MQETHELIPSQAMGRRMHLWCHGNFGAPVLVFPSAAGMAHEWKAQGMTDALADLIGAGKIKLYCSESNVAEAWTRKESDPAWRIKRHQAFEQYVVEELVPYIRRDCRTPDIKVAVTGVSLGAFYAVNFALKHSSIFNYALCLSGRYDVTWLTGGITNSDIYFNNPMAYAPNLNGDHLEAIRRNTHIALVCGQGAWEDGNIEDTRALAGILDAKGISHQCDMWGPDVSHGWEWWKRQVRHHLSGAFAK